MTGYPRQTWEEVGSRVDRPDITASEVADYAFCARSWWLKRVCGVEADGERLEVGLQAHEAAGALLGSAARAERVVTWLIWALVVLGIAMALLLGSRLGF